MDIPKSLRPLFGGKPRFVQSLRTESLTVAERRCLPVVANWKSLIASAKNGDPTPLNDHVDDAILWQEMLYDATDADSKAGIEYGLSITAEKLDKEKVGRGVELYKVATRQWHLTSRHVEDWLATLSNEPKSIDMKRTDLDRLSSKFHLTRDVRRNAVRQWVVDLQQRDGLKTSTVRRIISTCRGYWRYLQMLEVVPDSTDPFNDVVPANSQKTKAEVAAKRRAFTAAAVLQLHQAAIEKEDSDLADLITLAMWTGCRIEELCSLKVAQVHSDYFEISEAKSEAGWREVPIHSKLAPLIEQLVTRSIDGYLLSGLTKNKYGDRSNAIGKRFGRLKTSMGFGSNYVFHSIRKTVATQLDAAGIPEPVTARILGHDIPTMTYGIYSAGAPMAVKKEAIEKLEYPSK
ncbi:MAG: tyrosine-type recombinase/integrase [Marivivens sp.]|nr:tyrosine-type recombinase/integrase [Marivivens sp.]